MTSISQPSTGTPHCFITMFRTAVGEHNARIAIESLRSFGSGLNSSPVCAFLIQPCEVSKPLKGIENVRFIHLNIPTNLQGFPFIEKALACHQAELLFADESETIIWIDPNCLIVNPPDLFLLDTNLGVALRPVHIKNIGSIAASPPDIFWQSIYKLLGIETFPFTVTSFCDNHSLRPYFNLHCFSFKPRIGLCRDWYEYFEIMVLDQDFQLKACQDELHQIFLHQAIFSTLVVKRLGIEEIRLLPPTYNYPLHLHRQVPLDKQADSINHLVNPVYEGRFSYPMTLSGLEVTEPLHSWLSKY